MRRVVRALRGTARSTRGAAAVEFAIVSGVLIVLLIGTVELGRALYVKNQISFLADRAARRVLIEPGIDAAELEADLREHFTAGNPDSLTISVAAQSTGGSDYRLVTVGFPLTLFIPNVSSGALSLSVTRMVPVG